MKQTSKKSNLTETPSHRELSIEERIKNVARMSDTAKRLLSKVSAKLGANQK